MPPKKPKSSNGIVGAQPQGIRKSERKRRPPARNASNEESEAPPAKKRKTPTSNNPQSPSTSTQPASTTSARKQTPRQMALAAAKQKRINSIQSCMQNPTPATSGGPHSRYGRYYYEEPNGATKTLEQEMQDRVEKAQAEAESHPVSDSASAPCLPPSVVPAKHKRATDESSTSEPSAKRQKPNAGGQSRISRSNSHKPKPSSSAPRSRQNQPSKRATSENHASRHANLVSLGQESFSHDAHSHASGENKTRPRTKSSSLPPQPEIYHQDANISDRPSPALLPPPKPSLSPIMESPDSHALASEEELTRHPVSGPKSPTTKQNNQPSAFDFPEHEKIKEPAPPFPPVDRSRQSSTALNSYLSNDDLVVQAAEKAIAEIEAGLAGRDKRSSSSRNQHGQSAREIEHEQKLEQERKQKREEKRKKKREEERKQKREQEHKQSREQQHENGSQHSQDEDSADFVANPQNYYRDSDGKLKYIPRNDEVGPDYEGPIQPLTKEEERKMFLELLNRPKKERAPRAIKDIHYENSLTRQQPTENQERTRAAPKRRARDRSLEPPPATPTNAATSSPAPAENQERRRAASKRRTGNRSLESPPATPAEAAKSTKAAKRTKTAANSSAPEGSEDLSDEDGEASISEWKLSASFFPKPPPKEKSKKQPFWQMNHRLPDPNDPEYKAMEKDIPELKNSIQNTSVPDGSDEKPHHDVQAMKQLKAFQDAWNRSYMSRDPGNRDIAERIRELIAEFERGVRGIRAPAIRRSLGSHVRVEVAAWGVRLALRIDDVQLHGDEEELLREIREWCEKSVTVKASIGDWVLCIGKWRF